MSEGIDEEERDKARAEREAARLRAGVLSRHLSVCKEALADCIREHSDYVDKAQTKLAAANALLARWYRDYAKQSNLSRETKAHLTDAAPARAHCPEHAGWRSDCDRCLAGAAPAPAAELAKDFDILYRTADALITKLEAACLDDPDPNAIAELGRQLARLRPAFEAVQSEGKP